jgi:hypothetical protein
MTMSMIENTKAIVAEARALQAAVTAGETLHAAVGRIAADAQAPESVRRAARKAWRDFCRAMDAA